MEECPDLGLPILDRETLSLDWESSVRESTDLALPILDSAIIMLVCESADLRLLVWNFAMPSLDWKSTVYLGVYRCRVTDFTSCNPFFGLGVYRSRATDSASRSAFTGLES